MTASPAPFPGLGRLTLVAVLLAATVLQQASAQFNIFKNYDKTPAKPPSYAKKSTLHEIDEYMTEAQLMMRTNRHGPVTATNQMGNTWSGFNEFKRLEASRAATAAANSGKSASAGGSASQSSGTATAAGSATQQRLRTRAAPLTTSAQGLSS